MYELSIDDILRKAIELDASDIHLVAGRKPILRVQGELMTSDMPAFTAENVNDLLISILSDRQKNIFAEAKELDFSYATTDSYQVRVNLHRTKGSVAATFRIIPSEIRNLEELHLPPILHTLSKRRQGLVILCGKAGTGKSTTLTYMINYINRHRKCKVITIEDPIEYVHKSDKSLIIQRELGDDTHSFSSALKYALRQDPDVVVVGEMRDLESISMALTTVETGHLVITTLHASDTTETINRIIDVYPSGKQDQIRMQLATNLTSVIGHELVPNTTGDARVLATEVLVSNLAVRNLIRRDSMNEIRGLMVADDDNLGMHTFEVSLTRLARDELITRDIAREYAQDPQFLRF